MIFVIPSVYFLIRFFQTEKEQLKTKETKLILGNFALAFSLTLAIHFYGTMIAGLCCIGIADRICFTHFLNKEYFQTDYDYRYHQCVSGCIYRWRLLLQEAHRCRDLLGGVLV